MLSPQDQQQLAAAFEDADCEATLAAVGVLMHATRPDLTKRLATMPYGHGTPERRRDVRARADAILMHREMSVTHPGQKAAVIAKLHGFAKITAQVDKLATGTGLARGINAEGLRIKDLICANPRRKAARVAVLRAAMVGLDRPINRVCADNDAS